MGESPPFEVLLSSAEVQAAVDAVAERIAPVVRDGTVLCCVLTGGLWFAADLMRALASRGRHPLFDALWLSAYGDERTARGEATLRAGLQRPVEGREVLIVDDVLESGLSLAEAIHQAREAGAAKVLTAVFARKPWNGAARLEPDFVAWEAPARFLAGYGMDLAGRYRGLAEVVAAD